MLTSAARRRQTDMRRALSLLLIAAALALPLAAKEKNKVKDKRFEPAPQARLSDAAGRYAGPDEHYMIELAFASGRLTGFMTLDGVRQALTDIVVAGSTFEATRGGERVRGRFMNRILNGHQFPLDFRRARLNRPLLQIPRLRQRARALRLDNSRALVRNAEIVA